MSYPLYFTVHDLPKETFIALRKYWIEIRQYTFIGFSLYLSNVPFYGNGKRTYQPLENKSFCLLTHFLCCFFGGKPFQLLHKQVECILCDNVSELNLLEDYFIFCYFFEPNLFKEVGDNTLMIIIQYKLPHAALLASNLYVLQVSFSNFHN